MDSESQDLVSSFGAEPDNEIVQATASAVEDSNEQNFDNTSDLDLVNVLYVERIPVVEKSQQAKLQQLIDTVKVWKQWEMNNMESMVQGKVKGGELTRDNTVEAKSKRTAYRIKVQEYYRRQASWLGIRKEETQSKQEKASAKSINLKVLHMLLATSPLQQDIQFTTVLKALGLGFDAANSMVRPFSVTIVDYGPDAVSQGFRAQITTLLFDVVMQAVPETEKDPQVTATLNYTINQASFDTKLWEAAKPPASKVELGAKILPQKQLTLLQMEA